jgi:hypothetical protein
MEGKGLIDVLDPRNQELLDSLGIKRVETNLNSKVPQNHTPDSDKDSVQPPRSH